MGDYELHNSGSNGELPILILYGQKQELAEVLSEFQVHLFSLLVNF